jgi:hypothetical protein
MCKFRQRGVKGVNYWGKIKPGRRAVWCAGAVAVRVLRCGSGVLAVTGHRAAGSLIQRAAHRPTPAASAPGAFTQRLLHSACVDPWGLLVLRNHGAVRPRRQLPP